MIQLHVPWYLPKKAEDMYTPKPAYRCLGQLYSQQPKLGKCSIDKWDKYAVAESALNISQH